MYSVICLFISVYTKKGMRRVFDPTDCAVVHLFVCVCVCADEHNDFEKAWNFREHEKA